MQKVYFCEENNRYVLRLNWTPPTIMFYDLSENHQQLVPDKMATHWIDNILLALTFRNHEKKKHLNPVVHNYCQQNLLF